MTESERLGQLTGMLHETVLRLDRFELRETQIEQHLVDLIAEIRSKSTGAVMMGALCGAFAGSIAGAASSIVMINWMGAIIERAAQ